MPMGKRGAKTLLRNGNDLSAKSAAVAGVAIAMFLAIVPLLASQQPSPEKGSAALVVALRDQSASVRADAARALGQRREHDAVPALSELLLRDPDPRVRSTAAYALGLIQDPRATQPLLASLGDDHPEVCVNSVFALVQVRTADEQRLNAFKAALANPDLHVCRAAAMGLVMLGDKRAVNPLIDSLRDKRDSVRSGAAFALGYLGDRRAVSPLLNLLRDKRADVRKIAIASLGLLGDQRAVPALQRVAAHDLDAEVRARAAEVLKQLSPGSSQ